MNKHCINCGKTIDTIGFSVGDGRYVCDVCHGRCSMFTQSNLQKLSTDDILEEIRENERAAADKAVIERRAKQSRRVKSTNRVAWLMLVLLVLIIAVFTVFSQNSESPQNGERAQISAALSISTVSASSVSDSSIFTDLSLR